MLLDQFIQNCLTDTEVKVMELLHENIRRQAFFDKPWPAAKNPAKKGKKLLYQSGDMQDGYMSQIEDGAQQIRITNTVAYAGVHNEGAEIPVTVQMKKYFWAMYYKATGGGTENQNRSESGNLTGFDPVRPPTCQVSSNLKGFACHGLEGYLVSINTLISPQSYLNNGCLYICDALSTERANTAEISQRWFLSF